MIILKQNDSDTVSYLIKYTFFSFKAYKTLFTRKREFGWNQKEVRTGEGWILQSKVSE
jgi:hypothetical protein